jgi:Flp pilus assembly protein TadG
MTLNRLWRDIRGAAAVEFGMTAPIFFVVLFGIVNSGMLLWTQISLQHGAEMAARCASVSETRCGSDADIKSYAADQARAPNVRPDTFTVSTPACGVQVSASHRYDIFGFVKWGDAPLLSITLPAQACFPSAS